jgi:hypothetical protein
MARDRMSGPLSEANPLNRPADAGANRPSRCTTSAHPERVSTQMRDGALASQQAKERRPVCAKRLTYLDNVRVVMVAGVIVGHAIAGYAGMNWTYADVAEGEMGELSGAVFALLICRSRCS